MKLFRTHKWIDSERGYGDAETVEFLTGTKEQIEEYLVSKYEKFWWMHVGLHEITPQEMDGFVRQLLEEKHKIEKILITAEEVMKKNESSE